MAALIHSTLRGIRVNCEIEIFISKTLHINDIGVKNEVYLS